MEPQRERRDRLLPRAATRCRSTTTCLDGEVVAFADGVPELRRARRADARLRAPTAPARWPSGSRVTLLVFDLLRLGDRDLLDEPLERPPRRCWRASTCTTTAGRPRRRTTTGRCSSTPPSSRGSRGSSASGSSSRYRPGQRSKDWLKFAHRRRESYVVGGWRPETDSKDRLGALLVGEPTADGLRYRGRVGSGIAGKKALLLREVLADLTRDDRPFVDEVPRRRRPGYDLGRAGPRGRRRVPRPVRAGAGPPAVVRRHPRRPDPGGSLVRKLGLALAPAAAARGRPRTGAAGRRPRSATSPSAASSSRCATDTRQVVTVNHTRGYHARVALLGSAATATGVRVLRRPRRPHRVRRAGGARTSGCRAAARPRSAPSG